MLGKSRLQAELKRTRQQLEAMSINYSRIKVWQSNPSFFSLPSHSSSFNSQEASRKALDEFSRAKEDFSKEITMRQQLEYTIIQLRRRMLPHMGQEDYEQVRHLADLRVSLEDACKDLKLHRDTLLDEMKKAAGRKDWRYYPAQDEAYKVEIRSLQLERDMLRREVTKLHDERAEAVNEMVFINTRNAQLAEMTNDLSQRLAEREGEASSFMAGIDFLHHESTENPSPPPNSVAARSSISLPPTSVPPPLDAPLPPTPSLTPPTRKRFYPMTLGHLYTVP